MAGVNDQAVRAAHLYGAAGALRQEIGAPLPPGDREFYDRTLATTRAALDPATFEATWAEGRAMPLQQVIAYALGVEGSGGEFVSNSGQEV